VNGEIIRWGELAKRDPADLEGLRVLLGGGLVTVRSLGGAMRSAGGRDMHRLSYYTPWGSFEYVMVKGIDFTAVMTDVLGSEYNDQEERQ
jgi:hypothetical protein